MYSTTVTRCLITGDPAQGITQMKNAFSGQDLCRLFTVTLTPRYLRAVAALLKATFGSRCFLGPIFRV